MNVRSALSLYFRAAAGTQPASKQCRLLGVLRLRHWRKRKRSAEKETFSVRNCANFQWKHTSKAIQTIKTHSRLNNYGICDRKEAIPRQWNIHCLIVDWNGQFADWECDFHKFQWHPSKFCFIGMKINYLGLFWDWNRAYLWKIGAVRQWGRWKKKHDLFRVL